MAQIKARISVTLPKKACQEIRGRMLQDGYTLREKSKWYSEAIEEFLKHPNFYEYVESASLIVDFSIAENIYIPTELDEKLEKAIIEVRKNCPSLDGVKSLIVRASVIQRLITPLIQNSKIQ